MQQLARIPNDRVDVERALHFPLAVLKQGPLLPLKPNEDQSNPVLVPNEGKWPFALLDDMRRVFGAEAQPVSAPREAILLELNRIFDMASTSAEQMLEDLDDQNILSREIEEVKDLLDSEDEAPVIRLVNTLISQALKERASDIHIEPFERQVLVRFRVDGVLHTVVKPPKGVQAAIASRIKVMADLDIAEKRHPQDGRIRLRIAGREVDIRVSVLPTAFGERVVMRLLDRGKQMLTLPELGMGDRQFKYMEQAVDSAHGIVLVTGPTGSGKTTTLYGALMMDPDIIMIGEIRDLETAEIAIQASLTGHLVFSTLHTNDAISAVARLNDMGVEPYLVASSLLMVQAQRLVRILCPHCKQARPVDPAIWRTLGVSPRKYEHVKEIYIASGCDACMQTGYLGRIGLFEVVMVDSELRAAIHNGKSLADLKAIAMHAGMHNLRQDGARHIAAGLTTVDEVLRVTQQDSVVVEG